MLLSFDFLLSTCPSLVAAIHPPVSVLVLSPGSVAVIMKLTDISSLALDSLARARAYGDYLPIEEGATGSAHVVPAATRFFEPTVSSLFLWHFPSLEDYWTTSTCLHLSAFLVLSSPIPVIPHPQYISAFSPFPSLFLSLHRPHPLSGNYGKICNSSQRSW